MLDARSPLRGRITEPRIVWRQFVGQWESLVVIEPGARDSQLTLRDEEQIAEGAAQRYPLTAFIPAPKHEDDDNSSPNVTFADVLPNEPGKEKLEFESGFSKPTINGQWQKCVGRCFAKRNGQWVHVWETQPIDYLFQALPLAGDFDGDGQPAIAILPFYELLLLDARTGRIKDRCRFTDTRSYGHFGVYDFDGDGRSEFLIQADFSKHVDVLGFRDGKLRVLWQRLIEPDISNPQKILRVGPVPVADVDGDRRAEVLACVFNDSGDQRWHLTVHDALTGRAMADFADEHLAAPLDVDGDGVSELLTVRTEGGGVREFGIVRVRSLKHGRAETLWEHADSAWATWEPPVPPNVKSTATFGRRTVLWQQAGKVACAVLKQRGPSEATILSVARWEDSRFKEAVRITGEDLEPIGFDNAGRLLVRSRHLPGRPSKLSARRAESTLLRTARLGCSPGPVVVAWPDRAAEPTIIAQGCGEELVAFTPPRSSRSEEA
ncbi:MAG: VCBS repeat-containing protein, partial [Verrucomicrobia bacterium]|nr:VCBS repeat-containing protein [Verrucomicrobiota bacterium]